MNRFASKKEAVCLNQPKYDIKVPFYFDRPFFLQPALLLFSVVDRDK